jgi:putative OPT family oligopeptide transporter
MKNEITLKAFFLSILLSIILSSAMVYLGLYAGMTISASIPAAIMSMGILRLFKNSNILENNIVQTAASAGESLAAGVIFTLPALLLIGYWDSISYWEITKIAMVGGILGALFTVPLRRALILKAQLRFPEGVATAAVLKTGHETDANKSKESLKMIAFSALLGGFVKLGELAFSIWSSALGGAVAIKGAIFGMGASLSPSLISVGYIVGRNIGILVFSGGVISWIIAIPIYSYMYGFEGGNYFDIANGIWNAKIRYLGVGAMVVGGIWSVIQLAKPLIESIQLSIKTLKESADNLSLEEKDLPINYVFMAILAMLVPISLTYFGIIGSWTSAIILSLVMTIFGFLFSAVAAYMAGVVGSSNNPISGVTIATILFSSLLIISFFDVDSSKGAAAAILIGAVVCCAAAIGGDNLQDLKTGNIVGATPWKQQLMQLVGVSSAALTLGIVLTLLHEAYGIGSSELPAPQAVLMTNVANGVFSGNLEWGMIYAGAILGIFIILLDQYQARRNAEFRFPILVVAIGIYLPVELTLPIFIGGMLNHFASKTASEDGKNNGLLMASGLITGEALMAIFIAVPLFFDKNYWPSLSLPSPMNDLVGLAIIIMILYRLFLVAKK